jgi:hypothetical protein
VAERAAATGRAAGSRWLSGLPCGCSALMARDASVAGSPKGQSPAGRSEADVRVAQPPLAGPPPARACRSAALDCAFRRRRSISTARSLLCARRSRQRSSQPRLLLSTFSWPICAPSGPSAPPQPTRMLPPTETSVKTTSARHATVVRLSVGSSTGANARLLLTPRATLIWTDRGGPVPDQRRLAHRRADPAA